MLEKNPLREAIFGQHQTLWMRHRIMICLLYKAGMGHQMHWHMELVCLMGSAKRLLFFLAIQEKWIHFFNTSSNYSCISRWPTALPQGHQPLISILFIGTKSANSAAKHFFFIREETNKSQFINVQEPMYTV